MHLQQNDDFDSVSTWLNDNLDENYSFKPHQDNIPNIDSKGIYFWLMHPDGYKQLSNFVTIAAVEPLYKRKIDGIEYDLVYVGTAGTGKKGNSNLQERFHWHIYQKHNNSNVCHGTLSTLRSGLGALLSDDLILPNTEKSVDEFITKYMELYWIEYQNNRDFIDPDEKILINCINPLLNLKNNLNARANAMANSTQVYKRKRSVVYITSRLRLSCSGASQVKMKKINNVNEPIIEAPSYHHQLIDDNSDNGCQEFFVLRGQNIAQVVYGIECLPLGKCKIKMFDSKNPNNILFPKWRRTGNKVAVKQDAQNIYTYFTNTGGNNGFRWQQILDEMDREDIEEITVKVCPVY